LAAVQKDCGHCGRQGTLKDVDQVKLSEEHEEHKVGPYVDDMVVEQYALVQTCTECDGLTLSTYTWVDGYMEGPDDVPFKVLFPTMRPIDALPERVGMHYSKMLQLRYEPPYFAVGAGKTLEAVCTDQGIPKEGVLEDRLDALVARGDVPKPLADQAHLVRKYRNIGGHDDEVEVEAADVPLIRGFVEALLTFLYWGPKELARANLELEKRKVAAKNSAQPRTTAKQT
jgi:hypothetical protein